MCKAQLQQPIQQRKGQTWTTDFRAREQVAATSKQKPSRWKLGSPPAATAMPAASAPDSATGLVAAAKGAVSTRPRARTHNDRDQGQVYEHPFTAARDDQAQHSREHRRGRADHLQPQAAG